MLQCSQVYRATKYELKKILLSQYFINGNEEQVLRSSVKMIAEDFSIKYVYILWYSDFELDIANIHIFTS